MSLMIANRTIDSNVQKKKEVRRTKYYKVFIMHSCISRFISLRLCLK